MSSLSPPPTLPERAVDAFHDLGYAVVSGIGTPDDLLRVQELLDPLFDRFESLPASVAVDLGGGGPTPSIPELNATARLEPRLLDTRVFHNCRRAAERLCGRRVTFWGDHAIYKPAHNKRATAWHQDRAYAGHPFSDDVVTFWVPLQDVTEEMGCMRFVPRSHRAGLLPHAPREGGAASRVLSLRNVDEDAALACPIPTGSATVHGALTIHATGPNATDRMRRAWIVAFSPCHPYGIARAATAAVALARTVRAAIRG